MRRLRPRGRDRQGLAHLRSLPGLRVPIALSPGILQVSGQGSAGIEVEENQILLWQQVLLLQNVTSHLPR